MLKWISWMHPSYRDLIIDEMVSNDDLRAQFFENMSVQGIKLAISDTGGGEGDRRLPLIIDSNSWDMLLSRCVQISAEPDLDDADLLTVLKSAVQTAQGADEGGQLERIIKTVCDCIRNKWNSNIAVISARAIRNYCQASELLRPLPPLPHLDQTWHAICDQFEQSLTDAHDNGRLEIYDLESWAELLAVIKDNEPRFLRQVEFPMRFHGKISELLELIDTEVSDAVYDLTLDQLRDLSDRFDRFRDCLRIFKLFQANWSHDLQNLLEKLVFAIQELDDHASELEESEYDEDYDDVQNQDHEFDIDSLFSDL